MTEKKQTFISLDTILDRSNDDIKATSEGEFEIEGLGLVPYTSVDHDEYKAIKKATTKMVPNGTGGMHSDVDEDEMMLQLIVEAVHKDKRSTFTFRDKRMLDKFGVTKDTSVVKKIMKPGEVVKFALAIQNASGFGKKAQAEASDAVKNS